MNEIYNDLEPREVWRHFGALNNIPHPSGHEAAARDYCRQVAENSGATTIQDARGNLIVRVPASPGFENVPSVALQAHLDMVSQKLPDIQHNFETDPIIPRRDANKIFATGTTLGADNGIGAALMLAILTSQNLQHGPLELLFTIEEETGLHGAAGLDASQISARMLINLDSEDPGEITIGCAGGAGTTLRLPIEWQEVSPHFVGREIVVSGLKGGHSGVQIHEPLGNAIKILSEVLHIARGQYILSPPVLSAIEGGSAHNAIPRDAVATISVAPQDEEKLQPFILKMQDLEGKIRGASEPELKLEVREITAPRRALITETFVALYKLLAELPHGVLQMSERFPGKVQTSANLAEVHTLENFVEIHVSVRSFIAAELQKVQDEIREIGEKFGAEIEVRDGYPGWEPDADSQLLKVAREVYANIYGCAPKVEVVHAGLECGVIAAKIPNLQAISFGPLIRGAHSPEEFVEIESVGTSWKMLCELLAALANI